MRTSAKSAPRPAPAANAPARREYASRPGRRDQEVRDFAILATSRLRDFATEE